MYGWTVRECLAMPARQFFTMLKTGRELESQKKYKFLSDLCDVAFISNASSDYSKQLKQCYDNISNPERQTTSVMDANDPSTGSRIMAAFRMGVR